jgi:thiol-disulfide isomerase/thioredoxin
MRSYRVRAGGASLLGIFVACAVSFAVAPVSAQTGGQGNTSSRRSSAAAVKPIKESFPPLEAWRQAVLAGNKEVLSVLYSSNPPAKVVTSLGDGTASQDVAFWGNVKTAGLKALDVKMMLKETTPQGITQLALRMYLTIQTSGGPEDFVVGASQMWAQINGNWQIVGMQHGDPVPRPKLTLPEPAVPNPNLYPDPSEATKEIEQALAAAKLDHKNVILVFGGNWCFDCHVLDDAFRTSPTIAPLVRRYYHVVHVNIGSYDANQDIADRYQVSLKKGVPALAILDSGGKLLTSTSQGEFESAVKIGPADVASFLNKWKPAHMPSASSKQASHSPS